MSLLEVAQLSYSSGTPLQGNLQLTGYGLTDLVGPAPANYAFYTLRGTAGDAFQNFSSLTLFGAPVVTNDDGVNCYRLVPASSQYAALPVAGGGPYDLPGFIGEDGADAGVRGARFWDCGGKFKPEAMPVGSEERFVAFAGTASQHIAVYFTADGALHARFKNGAYEQVQTIAGAVALNAWTGFSYRHRPAGTARYLEFRTHAAALQSVEGDIQRDVGGTLYQEFSYWVPAAATPIQIGRGEQLTAPAGTVYSALLVRDFYFRNAAMESEERVLAVIDPALRLQVAWEHQDTLVETLVNAYVLVSTADKITMSVPELATGPYLIRVRYLGHGAATPRPFTLQPFVARIAPLHLDFSTATATEIHQNLMAAHKQWGGANGGVVVDNVTLNRTAGRLELAALGDQYTGPIQGVDRDGLPSGVNTRIGACVVTRDYYGPGSYRVRLRPALRTGVVNAIWSFHYEEGYPGSPVYDSHVADGLHLSGSVEDGYYTVRNHEIDIEWPTALKTTPDQTNVAFTNARMNTWRGELRNWAVPNNDVPVSDPMYSAVNDPAYWSEYTDHFNAHGVNLADGAFHELRYDWHLGGDPRVEFYVDGVLQDTIRTHVPDIPGRFWVGLWFPSGAVPWAGATAPWVQETMLIENIDITPFADEYV